MNKKYLLLGLCALFLGGCGTTANLNKNQQGQEGTGVVGTEENKNGSLATLKDLLAGGKDQKCSWTFVDGEQIMEGTILISGKKFRQEMNMNDPTTGKKIQVLNISDGEYMYSWNTMVPEQGVKIKLTEGETAPETGENSYQGKPDWGKRYEYKCENWTVNAADLTPPSNITFVDMEAQIKQLEDMQKKFGGGDEIPGTEN